MSATEEPRFFRRHRWTMRLSILALAITGAVVLQDGLPEGWMRFGHGFLTLRLLLWVGLATVLFDRVSKPLLVRITRSVEYVESVRDRRFRLLFWVVLIELALATTTFGIY